MSSEVDQAQQPDRGDLFIRLGSSSMKEDVVAALKRAGFMSAADGFRTISRDILAGRLQYRRGVLESQPNSAA